MHDPGQETFRMVIAVGLSRYKTNTANRTQNRHQRERQSMLSSCRSLTESLTHSLPQIATKYSNAVNKNDDCHDKVATGAISQAKP